MDKKLIEHKAKDMVMKAKVALQFRCPFYAVPVMHSHLIPSWHVPTAQVNKYSEIQYNPEWIEGLIEEEVPGLLCHEILHVMLLHLAQDRKLSPRIWKILGIAQDIKINYLIRIGTPFSLPKCGYIPDKNKHTCLIPCIKYTVRDLDKKSTEDVFNEILPHFPEDFGKECSDLVGITGENGRGGEGDVVTDIHDGTSKVVPGRGTGDEGADNKKLADEAKAIGDKWRQITANALTLAKQQGKIPAGMEHLIEELLEPKIDWREKLSRFLSDKIPFDFTWMSRNKRSRALGIYLPSMLGEQLDVVVHMDSSGSVFACAEEFLTEIKGILGCFDNVNMTLVVVDSELKGVYDLKTADVDDILTAMGEPVKGGGGTSHKPFVDWVLKNCPDAKVVVTLTDGYSDMETEMPRLSMPILTALGGGYYKTPNTFDEFSEVLIIDPK